jgi:phosphoribosylglycinamide formyltransferase-1
VSDQKRLIILASGSGSIAQAIIDAVESGRLPAEIATIISDQNSPVLERARSHGLDNHYLPMSSDRSQWNQELINLAKAHAPDLIVSVGFMRILGKEFIREFKVINTHPALLPAFPGAHPVRDALLAGVKESGVTVHWVDQGIDTGPIISQVKVPIHENDDESSLHERIKIQERILIVQTLRGLLTAGEE